MVYMYHNCCVLVARRVLDRGRINVMGNDFSVSIPKCDTTTQVKLIKADAEIAKEVTSANMVEVQNIPKTINDKELKTILQSRKYGGGPVSEINREESKATVTFENETGKSLKCIFFIKLFIYFLFN